MVAADDFSYGKSAWLRLACCARTRQHSLEGDQPEEQARPFQVYRGSADGVLELGGRKCECETGGKDLLKMQRLRGGGQERGPARAGGGFVVKFQGGLLLPQARIANKAPPHDQNSTVLARNRAPQRGRREGEGPGDFFGASSAHRNGSVVAQFLHSIVIDNYYLIIDVNSLLVSFSSRTAAHSSFPDVRSPLTGNLDSERGNT
jgi:hypothetical protein